ncbi:haloalkane dehalogenase [Kordiimonas sp. SCSIO 12610]|uniref:haloalkane dehalogenase n=1 Tax=Kordiimonas sp. SCSIO 12610 TaxID=2829597 RepID=UPI00210E2FFE|nr:haloalkane dehalogenase [Kordiimonas sp. SCSIO 12610]UTW55903.1 alpha/beta fold hydrolase [Kordiimonas sp. SCSIO 12610]
MLGIGILIALIVVALFMMQAPTSWTKGEVITTPEESFKDLPDYPFEANYVTLHGYRVHYVDEGPKDGKTVLLMHGQPSWSYLYRHMIPLLAKLGYRVIAPDLVGFGKSDKPLNRDDHNYQMHIDVMNAFMKELDLSDVSLFAQDWGGLIGLRMVASAPQRFGRIMLSNTGLPAMGGIKGWLSYPLFKLMVMKEGKPETIADKGEFRFTRWVAWAKHTPTFDLAGLFQQSTSRELSDVELAGYAAPFPDEKYMAAIRKFPTMVPSQLLQNQRVMDEVFAKWNKPFLTAFGDSDPVTKGRDKIWHKVVPGAEGQPHTTIKDGAHFIQEDKPEELVEVFDKFIKSDA